MKLLLDDGDEHVGGDGAPDLCLHGVLAGAQESLDTQVLLDPFEEQLDLPATFVERGNRQGGPKSSVVLLVRKTSVLPDSGSLNRMRRRCSGYFLAE